MSVAGRSPTSVVTLLTVFVLFCGEERGIIKGAWEEVLHERPLECPCKCKANWNETPSGPVSRARLCMGTGKDLKQRLEQS